jgi:hypothetical protein
MDDKGWNLWTLKSLRAIGTEEECPKSRDSPFTDWPQCPKCLKQYAKWLSQCPDCANQDAGSPQPSVPLDMQRHQQHAKTAERALLSPLTNARLYPQYDKPPKCPVCAQRHSDWLSGRTRPLPRPLRCAHCSEIAEKDRAGIPLALAETFA